MASGTLRQIEQRYRAIGTQEELAQLARYFDVPAEEILQRQPWTRKALSEALVEANEQSVPIRLELRSGEKISGQVMWSDLGATLIETPDGQQIVVQRHIVDRWELLGDNAS